MLTAKRYSLRTMRNYVQEMRFLFAHYYDPEPCAITGKHIIAYINYIIKEYEVGREKCHQVAQACSFFFKHVLPTPFAVPAQFYPRKENKLPQVFSIEQIKQLLLVISNVKHRMIISLFYGSGLRLNELRNVRLCDIDSKAFQVKVVAGKGRKDRFTLLPKHLLTDLRKYYVQYNPAVYLFEGQAKGRPLHERSIQHFVQLNVWAAIEKSHDKRRRSTNNNRKPR